MNIGLVIQGPLISKGKSGATGHPDAANLGDKGLVEFPCFQNIDRLLGSFGYLFKKIVCIAWNNEDQGNIEKLEKIAGPKNVVLISDTSRAALELAKKSQSRNKYRQFTSSLRGVEEVKKSGCDFAVKVRSDQFLNLKRLHEDYMQILDTRGTETMLVPKGRARETGWISDFYFCGPSNLLSSAFQRYLQDNERSHDVHVDIFYCWAEQFLGRPPMSLRWRKTKYFNEYNRESWNTVFCPGSRDLYNSLIWRGAATAGIPEVTNSGSIVMEDLTSDLKLPEGFLESDLGFFQFEINNLRKKFRDWSKRIRK